MMSVSPPACTGYTARLEVLARHCDIVETETKVGLSVVSHFGAAVSHDRLSGRDPDQIVAQLMRFARP
jgi:hypothetical protein